ncbi:MAG: phosphatidate cytidylyltransferase, partial [Planctomycetes bacterium]|nr:phosphatidate cytidylyltransferase [Planctomycetota bacterium]
LMGLVYVWFLPSFLAKMRHLGFPGAHGWRLDGVEFIIVTVFVAKICDVGGLFVGKRYGRHKLCPHISPNKTWEGFGGGILASVGLAVYMSYTAPESVLGVMGLLPVIIFGVLMAVSSLLGDLLESAMKRDSEMKDAGGSIPGYGGMLDVADSLMVSGPVAYFFFIFMGARPAL